MLELTFGPLDVGRVRFAVSMIAQGVRSTCTKDCPRKDHLLQRWQQRVRSRCVPRAVEPLVQIVNAQEGYYPDLLTPDLYGQAGARWSFDDEMDLLLDLPADVAATDFGSLGSVELGARLTDRFASPQGPGRKLVVDALRAYHQGLLAEDWPRIRAFLEADIARRAILLATHGVDHVLATLHDKVRWNPPVLTIDPCRPKRFHLGGRGLLLVPSVFCSHSVAWILNERQQPTLVYPAGDLHQFWIPGPGSSAPDGLEALIGRARAATLRAIGSGCGTGELANRLGVSPATASEHAAVLRRGSLVATQREGQAVRHTLTRWGADFLNFGQR